MLVLAGSSRLRCALLGMLVAVLGKQCAFPGRYLSRDGLECRRCAAGRYQTYTGFQWHHVCFRCPFGKLQPYEGQTSCLQCKPGQFIVSAIECVQWCVSHATPLLDIVSNTAVAAVRADISSLSQAQQSAISAVMASSQQQIAQAA